MLVYICWTEERERPELLAESPERRKRVAKDSGKTEQQVGSQSDLRLISFKCQNTTNKRFSTMLLFVVWSGERTCSTDIPNESENEELDGSNGRWINSCIERS